MNTLPRFFCDGMLGGLCRYLRAAGYDTDFANNSDSDRDLLRRCQDENRYFLTQDRLIREHKAAQDIAIILSHGNLDWLAMQLATQLRIDWLTHAFTRCLRDNTPLQTADTAALQRIPADARRPGDHFSHCPTCDRVFWRGSHYQRMHARLARWQEGKFMAETDG